MFLDENSYVKNYQDKKKIKNLFIIFGVNNCLLLNTSNE